MPPRNFSTTGSIIDGGLGLAAADDTATSAKIGVCTGGVVGKTYAFEGSDTQVVIDTLVSGPLCDATIAHLIQSKGKKCFATRAASSTAGSSTSVTRSGGTAGPLIALSDAPDDQYDSILRIKEGGALGTATFDFSLDGGDTYSIEYATAASYELPSGVTVDFPVTSVSMTGSPTDVDFDGTAHTIARNTGSFVTDGFRAGMVLTIAGTTNNNGTTTAKIVTVATGLLTLDGGLTTEASVNAPTITGTQLYVADEIYSWTDTAPAMTISNVGDACDALLVAPIKFSWIHVVGSAADPADTLTLATLLSVKRALFHAADRFIFFFFEGPEAPAQDVVDEFAGFIDPDIFPIGGFSEQFRERTDIAGAQVLKRSDGRVIVPRVAAVPLSTHPLRNPSDSDIDPITQVVRLVPDGDDGSTGYHDENATPIYTAGRFGTLRTFAGLEGFYVAGVPAMSSATSDYQDVMARRIVLAAAQAFHNYALHSLGRRLRKDPATGFLLGSLADALEDEGSAVVAQTVGPHVDGLQVLVNRTDNIAQVKAIRATIRLVGPDFAYSFDWEIGLTQTIAA